MIYIEIIGWTRLVKTCCASYIILHNYEWAKLSLYLEWQFIVHKTYSELLRFFKVFHFLLQLCLYGKLFKCLVQNYGYRPLVGRHWKWQIVIASVKTMLNSNGYSYKTELTGKIDIIGYIFTEIEIDIHILCI